jgi:murein L,D-transpeptidase YcbB/YkuD
MAKWRDGAAFAARGLLFGSAALAAIGTLGFPDRASAQTPAPAVAETTSAAVPVTAAWSIDNARALAEVIAGAGAEGLRPGNYRLAALKRAIAEGEGPALDAVAQSAALSLARDYWMGRVADRAAMDWHIERPEGAAMLPGELKVALATNQVGKFFKALLPHNERYDALRTALAVTPDGAARDRIRANLERWRWMPRTMGDDYIFVNVPSYHLQLVQDGRIASVYTVVVGAKDTPTPLLASWAPSLVVNPSWYVPASIVKKSNLRAGQRGFVRASAEGGLRQPPGPHNALGKLKINLVNTPAIYLHDTNAKSAFNRDERDLSHGCVRVKDIDQLAAELIRDGGGDEGAFQEAYADSDTRTLTLPKQYGVYLVYFTMDLNADGDLASYGDPYGRDTQVIAGLDGAPTAGMQIASN